MTDKMNELLQGKEDIIALQKADEPDKPRMINEIRNRMNEEYNDSCPVCYF